MRSETTEEQMREIVEAGGGIWVGYSAEQDFVYLDDPRTKSGGVIPAAELSIEAVRAKVAEIRARFADGPRSKVQGPRSPK
jgi:hypothetical protein